MAVFFWKRANTAGAISSIVRGLLITVYGMSPDCKPGRGVSGAGGLAGGADRRQPRDRRPAASRIGSRFFERRIDGPRRNSGRTDQAEARRMAVLRSPPARSAGLSRARTGPPACSQRRWYYFIPATGEPRGLVHRIESGMLDAVPGEKVPYSSWTEQVDGLKNLLGRAQRVAMQYSPNCAVPYVSMVDAGTLELVRGTGVEVVTSAELIQAFRSAMARRRRLIRISKRDDVWIWCGARRST